MQLALPRKILAHKCSLVVEPEPADFPLMRRAGKHATSRCGRNQHLEQIAELFLGRKHGVQEVYRKAKAASNATLSKVVLPFVLIG